jgi:hypothetical protein
LQMNVSLRRARISLREEEGPETETFRSDPVGIQSHLAKPGQQPEASLACA